MRIRIPQKTTIPAELEKMGKRPRDLLKFISEETLHVYPKGYEWGALYYVMHKQKFVPYNQPVLDAIGAFFDRDPLDFFNQV